ncbi:MAG TPA: DNA internalization-related competence protein ComEC/Rec2, partial [Usitatibacter sp.]|nr:DNA internalization-related competence protein ComEC/Rec2 [Usitatibacter sp.]
RTSSTPALVEAVDPAIAILSVGYRNRFHHPSPAVVARYAARGVELRRTDAEGALRVVLPAGAGGEPTVAGQRAACRYWSAREDCLTARAAP